MNRLTIENQKKGGRFIFFRGLPTNGRLLLKMQNLSFGLEKF
ncbi:hypothetical protein C4J96_2082 [Pseudomonas orientalis]|nr:hypothetical protein C4J96_2082 [Pseudomonas orientalis]